jgi:hypothetical protein
MITAWLLANTLWLTPVNLAGPLVVGEQLSRVRVPPSAPAPPIDTLRGPSGRVRGFRLGDAAQSPSSIVVEN